MVCQLPTEPCDLRLLIADLRLESNPQIGSRKSAIEMIPDGLEPSFSGCKPGVVAAGPRDHDRLLKAEAVRLELTSEMYSPPVFETGSSTSRMTSMNCGGRNRTHVTTVQSRLPVPAQAPPHQVSFTLRGQESNLRTRRSKQRISTNRNYPASLRVPCGNRTRLSSLEGWHLCRSAKGTCILRQAEAVGLEPTSDMFLATCFQDRAPHPAG